jgi:hypothetical protein
VRDRRSELVGDLAWTCAVCFLGIAQKERSPQAGSEGNPKCLKTSRVVLGTPISFAAAKTYSSNRRKYPARSSSYAHGALLSRCPKAAVPRCCSKSRLIVVKTSAERLHNLFSAACASDPFHLRAVVMAHRSYASRQSGEGYAKFFERYTQSFRFQVDARRPIARADPMLAAIQKC